MSSRRVVLRSRADRDLRDALAHYLHEGGEHVAVRFIEAVEDAFRHIGRYPRSGSPRYAVELDVPELRCWPIRRYPYLVFYIERDDHLDVWRILQAQRDIPAWMREEPDGQP